MPIRAHPQYTHPPNRCLPLRCAHARAQRRACFLSYPNPHLILPSAPRVTHSSRHMNARVSCCGLPDTLSIASAASERAGAFRATHIALTDVFPLPPSPIRLHRTNMLSERPWRDSLPALPSPLSLSTCFTISLYS